MMSLYQVFSSPVIYVSIIGVTVLCFASVWEEMSMNDASVAYLIEIFIGLTMFKKLVVLFAALPYVSSFCSDWKYQYIKPITIRTGIHRYIWSKLVTCFVSGCITVFAGMILFITILCIKLPQYPEIDANLLLQPPFGELAMGQFPVVFLLTQCFVFSLAAALWSVVGLTVSAFIPIHFVAVAVPVIASYFFEEFTMGFPNWLNFYLLTRGADVFHQGPYVSLVLFCVIFISFSSLTGLVFSYQVRRRLRNEVV
jgi:hypothetical protein